MHFATVELQLSRPQLSGFFLSWRLVSLQVPVFHEDWLVICLQLNFFPSSYGMKLQSGLNLFHSKGQIWICLMLTYVRNNYYSAFYWALIGSDLLSCWVHELFIFVLVSLIFIFWIILTLHYPDHSAHSPLVQIMDVWLYFYYYLCFSDNHLMRKFFLL